MKLIVAGSTGYLGTEVVRQALSHPAITTVVALSRRETLAPPNADPSSLAKLRSVVCNDFLAYSEDVERELAGAHACIWTIAITPSKSRSLPWEESCRINRDFTRYGLDAIAKLPRPQGNPPLRFVYLSGHYAERDQTKKPYLLGDMALLRGEVESLVLEYAQRSNGAVQSCVVKAGLIDTPGRRGPLASIGAMIGTTLIGLPRIDLKEISAALLDQAINGFEKDTLWSADMATIGKKAISSLSAMSSASEAR